MATKCVKTCCVCSTVRNWLRIAILVPCNEFAWWSTDTAQNPHLTRNERAEETYLLWTRWRGNMKWIGTLNRRHQGGKECRNICTKLYYWKTNNVSCMAKKRDSKCPNDYSNFTNAEAPAPPADDDDDRRSHTKDQRHSKSTKKYATNQSTNTPDSCSNTKYGQLLTIHIIFAIRVHIQNTTIIMIWWKIMNKMPVEWLQ